MKRAAVEIAREGHSVYHLRVPERINKKVVLDFLTSIGDKHVFFFIDEAAVQMQTIDEIVRTFPDANATFVFADRPHAALPRLGALRSVKPQVLDMPLLDREDSEAIIVKLTEFGQLGQLQ